MLIRFLRVDKQDVRQTYNPYKHTQTTHQVVTKMFRSKWIRFKSMDYYIARRTTRAEVRRLNRKIKPSIMESSFIIELQSMNLHQEIHRQSTHVMFEKPLLDIEAGRLSPSK